MVVEFAAPAASESQPELAEQAVMAAATAPVVEQASQPGRTAQPAERQELAAWAARPEEPVTAKPAEL